MTSATPISLDSLATPQTWTWRGFSICYQAQGVKRSAGGEERAAVVLIHGFGASWGHWRKNIPELSEHFRVYAIDLIGFGGSDKPSPHEIPYTFETWGAQIADFCREVVGTPVFLVGNSIGAIAAMQTAVDHPEIALGVALLDCSLRMLHDRRRDKLPWYRSIGTPILQNLLSIRWLGHSFFRLLANPKTVRKILLQAYGHDEAVTDELVAILMAPAADAGAADVFLAFTRYSQGPLPEDLLAVLPCPALMLWGTADPWEPIAQGRELSKFPCVQQFIPLEGIGHCPQDEAPEQVNPILRDWILALQKAA